MAVSLYMKKIYEEVGSKSDAEPEGKLTIEKNLHLLRDKVAFLIEESSGRAPATIPVKRFPEIGSPSDWVFKQCYYCEPSRIRQNCCDLPCNICVAKGTGS